MPPNYNQNVAPDSIKDWDTGLGRNAQSLQERFDTLQWCLANNWNGLDIGRLERRDTATFHGWLMWTFVATS